MVTSKTQLHIAKMLKRRRLSEDMTQSELAKKAGMHPNSYAKIERGDRNATVDTLEKIIKALGVHSSDILPF